MEIEYAHLPTRDWFEKLSQNRGTQSLRFALKADGSIFFGDSMLVTHQDIMQLNIPETGELLMIGSMHKGKNSGIWRLSTLQYWAGGSGGMSLGRKILPKLQEWQDMIVEMTALDPTFQDPCKILSWVELHRDE